jgi:hypothetical protein
MRIAWFVSGLLGAVLAVLSVLTPVAGVVGGALVLVSVVLQYLDSRPVDRIIGPDQWTQRDDGDWEYRPTGKLVRGRMSVQVFIRSKDFEGGWEEGMVASGIDDRRRPWVVLNEPIELRVIVR